LIALLLTAGSPKAGTAYLSLYLLFLAPVLFKGTPDTHYLYGPGAVLSLGLASLLTSLRTRENAILSTLSYTLLAAALIHSLANQYYLFQTGYCMNKIASTLESSHLTDSNPEKMAILVEPGAPGYVLGRYTKERDRVGSQQPVSFELIDWERRSEVKSNYLLNCDCIVYKPAVVELPVLDWGPRQTAPGVVPNQQPNGSAGIWIKVKGTSGFGDLQVLVDGEPAEVTVVQPDLITAAVAAENFNLPGVREISVIQVFTGRIYNIGTITIAPEQ
jgi:hypothetical protein